MVDLILGDCRDILKDIADNSIDSIVSDPPYEIGFMGKGWDKTGIANDVAMWSECLRVLKPGGYLLSFSATRTYHRMAAAIEDAGFEIRDMIEWVYGSGFPKSHNIGKAVDKLRGNGRKVIGHSEWEGWGTALKPAHEPICMARKPLSEKTVADNVLKWGTGGINIDGSRVESSENWERTNENRGNTFHGQKYAAKGNTENHPQGRFPSNFIHNGSGEVLSLFPNTLRVDNRTSSKSSTNSMFFEKSKTVKALSRPQDNGGNASRYFKSIVYYPKASKKERNRGCEMLEQKANKFGNQKNGQDLGNGSVNDKFTTQPNQNNHPTVKPVGLMAYLIKMVTPQNGVVLDPFMGSGTTGIASVKNGFKFIGIERNKGYLTIAKARINHNLLGKELKINK